MSDPIAGKKIARKRPWSAPILVEHVTTPNIYWRLFYLLPFPLSMGIAVGLLSERTGMLHSRARTVATACSGLALAVALGASSPTSIFQPPLRFGRAEYKLSRDHLEVARRIVEVAPPGPMLSPLDIANIVPSLSGEHPGYSR